MNYINFNFKPVQAVTPGAGLRTQFHDEATKITIVSDEIVWNEYSANGVALDALIDAAHARGEKAAIVITPYSLMPKVAESLNLQYPGSNFGTDTFDNLMAIAMKADIIGVDAYYFGASLGVSMEELTQFTKDALAWIDNAGKDSMLVVQGFAMENREGVLSMIMDQVALGYDYVTEFTAEDAMFPASYDLPASLWNTPVEVEIIGQPTYDYYSQCDGL